MPKQTIRDLELSGKKVLVRVDFNVPQTKDGGVSDDRRIKAALPTLNYALEKGASLILVSHLGRPTGNPEEDVKFTLDAVATRLGELLGKPVKKVGDTVGPEAKAAAAALKPGEVVVLENVRFNKGEKKGDPAFAAELASLADVYVNDAFGTSHRDEASMVAVPAKFDEKSRGIGFLIEKELSILDTLLKNPEAADDRRHGRGEGLRQDPGDRKSPAAGRSTPHRRGDDVYVPQGPGPFEIGKSRCEARPAGRGEATPRTGRARSSCCRPITSSPRLRMRPRRPGSWSVRTSRPTCSGWTSGRRRLPSIPGNLIQQAGTVVWNGPMGKVRGRAVPDTAPEASPRPSRPPRA